MQIQLFFINNKNERKIDSTYTNKVEKAMAPHLPGKSHGWRSLVGCSPWGCKELDTTERLLSLFTFLHWKRKWQPTPVFLPGESQGRQSLVGCHLWGRTGSDTTEATQQQQQHTNKEYIQYATPNLNMDIEASEIFICKKLIFQLQIICIYSLRLVANNH